MQLGEIAAPPVQTTSWDSGAARQTCAVFPVAVATTSRLGEQRRPEGLVHPRHQGMCGPGARGLRQAQTGGTSQTEWLL